MPGINPSTKHTTSNHAIYKSWKNPKIGKVRKICEINMTVSCIMFSEQTWTRTSWTKHSFWCTWISTKHLPDSDKGINLSRMEMMLNQKVRITSWAELARCKLQKNYKYFWWRRQMEVFEFREARMTQNGDIWNVDCYGNFTRLFLTYCCVSARRGLQQTTLGSGQQQDTGSGILWSVHRWTRPPGEPLHMTSLAIRQGEAGTPH